MGPLYHLVLEEDRRKVVAQAFGLLKKGGILFSAFISRYGIWGDIMRRLPGHIEQQGNLTSVLERGRNAEVPHWQGAFRAYFASPAEVIPLHERAGFTTLVLAGVEPVGASDDAYSKLTESQRKLWLDLLHEISSEPSTIGASCHMLYIGRK